MFDRTIVIIGFIVVNSAAVVAQPPRPPVAQSNSPNAAFAARAPGDTAFRNVADKAELSAGDSLLGFPGANAVSKDGSVGLSVPGDYDSRSPLPILETAFTLKDPDKDTSLDLTLLTGRVNITNLKPDGQANATVRFADQTWKLFLETPKTKVTVLLSGRWPAGSRFKPANPKADQEHRPAPLLSAGLVVLSGSVSVDMGGVTVAMKAPPGPADLEWNSLSAVRPQPRKLEKLPIWADPDAKISDQGRNLAVAWDRFLKARIVDPTTAFDRFLNSIDENEQRVALIMLGGQDDLERLEKVLSSPRNREQADSAIGVLRHWLGRAQGNDQRLYQHLIGTGGYTEGHARVIVQLLLGFTKDDLAEPETYEVLIDYLAHPKQAIRTLAVWHLVRLVPDGKTITVRAEPTDDDLRKFQAAWRVLIPSGKLPVTVKKSP
jgi:hypothetical protein